MSCLAREGLIARDKALFSIKMKPIFLSFLHENIRCGYSLEVPHQGVSNEYPHISFHREIRKILPHMGTSYPLLWVIIYSISDTVHTNNHI